MSKFLIGILFITFSQFSRASAPKDKKLYNLLTFKQIEAESPWLQSGNAAGLSLMPELFPAELELGYRNANGDFHSVFSGATNQAFNFNSRSFRKINNTFLYGSFGYNRSSERKLNFSDVNDPTVNYPYLLVDTIGNDTYSREFFDVAGIISSPVNDKLVWGLSFDYRVGMAAQDRDPRPENKVLQTHISPGLLFKANHFRLGASLTYGYYNEDIDVSVVKESTQQTLFQMHGPGMFSYHSSSSFARLYRQNSLGGGLQVEWNRGKISDLLHSGYVYSVQTIDDGRLGGQATWAAVKNDARLNGLNWNLTNVLSIAQEKKVHQLKAVLNLNSKLGTEFIQRLEEVNETGIEQWKTYGTEQKYYALQTNAGLDYQLVSKDETNRMNSLFRAGLDYSAFDEKYYMPNQELSYSNFKLRSSFLKLVVLPKANIAAELRLSYQFNLEAKNDLTVTNFLVQKIDTPEFNYLTEDFLSPGISAGCEIPLQKTFDRYFLKTDFDWYHSATGKNRTVFNFSTGFIF